MDYRAVQILAFVVVAFCCMGRAASASCNREVIGGFMRRCSHQAFKRSVESNSIRGKFTGGENTVSFGEPLEYEDGRFVFCLLDRTLRRDRELTKRDLVV